MRAHIQTHTHTQTSSRFTWIRQLFTRNTCVHVIVCVCLCACSSCWSVFEWTRHSERAARCLRCRHKERLIDSMYSTVQFNIQTPPSWWDQMVGKSSFHANHIHFTECVCRSFYLLLLLLLILLLFFVVIYVLLSIYNIFHVHKTILWKHCVFTLCM